MAQKVTWGRHVRGYITEHASISFKTIPLFAYNYVLIVSEVTSCSQLCKSVYVFPLLW